MVKLLAIFLLGALLGASQCQVLNVGDFPSHVGLHIVGGRFGEGVILNENHVLTLAENVFGMNVLNQNDNRNVRLAPADITVSAGVAAIPATPVAPLPIIRIYAHDHYNFHSGKFNVAVLRMANNFNFPPHAPAPAIAPVIFHNRIVDGNRLCSMVGFLLVPNTQNRQLQAASLGVFDRQTCNAVDNPAIRGSVFDQHICVGGIAQTAINCNFNNGAAYYCDGELVGLRSLGLVCNAINSPGVVVQTRWFQDWIPQQFNRTDNPLPGPVTPPGVADNNGASSIILSTITLAFALFIGMMW